ncbi:Chloride channel protein 2 [Trichinella zimbabwensis]|uniref:Chloride channel protein 2 n=1 Tax=Trichinella zimbabwensis TaxID=268475 RepID=A0A0V1H6F0_9BILA|nr:Chloride channel protein 2 [Trichinella zimbabwensis]
MGCSLNTTPTSPPPPPPPLPPTAAQSLLQFATPKRGFSTSEKRTTARRPQQHPNFQNKRQTTTLQMDNPSTDNTDNDQSKKQKVYRKSLENVYEILINCMSSDWMFLAVLGILMGTFSFGIDNCVRKLRSFHFFLIYQSVKWGVVFQWCTWVGFALFLILFAAGLCHYVAPEAAGSGIPEMKTLLRGVVLKEYLTFRTFIVKVIGLTMALSSSLPLGKEGPFVHIASHLATLLSKWTIFMPHAQEDSYLNKEILAAACAVGVASTYGAPVGGVLFSIEVTSVFFPLRNYWRCFLASLCSAIVFRLLTVAFAEAATVEAFCPTSFPAEFPFDILYLIPVCLLGAMCGLFGAAFVHLFKLWTKLIKQTKWVLNITKRSPFIYPALVVLFIATLNCPALYGKYFAGGLTSKESVEYLFQNFSWTNVPKNSTINDNMNKYWSLEKTNLFLPLTLFTINMFWMTAMSITMAVPSGTFIPIFVTGAGFGRLFGEIIPMIFPNGLPTINDVPNITPGGYAVIGAAAFSGSVTRAISTSVVVIEMTGQTTYFLPTIIAVLVSNAVCSRLENSLYDTIICNKKLPYLPPIPPTSSAVHMVTAKDIMIDTVHYLTLNTTLGEMVFLLRKYPNLDVFPLVDSKESMILLGCIRTSELVKLIWPKQSNVELFEEKYHHPRSTTDDSNYLKNNNSLYNNSSLIKKILLQQSVCERTGEEAMQWLNDKNTLQNVEDSSKSIQSALKKNRNMVLLPLLKLHERRHSQEDTNTIERWISGHWNDKLKYDNIEIDPTPVQLLERTSLHKIHTLFSLLGLHILYVTKLGRLVGVVSLKELREALENVPTFVR